MRTIVKALSEGARRAGARLSGRAYLPEALRHRLHDEGGALLVHISDTPWEIYPFLRRLLRQVKPRYVIHTGDLVDDLKLEYDPHKRQRWVDRARSLYRILVEDPERRVMIVPGNHDDPDQLVEIAGDLSVEPGMYEMAGRAFHLDHYGPSGDARAEFDLFGHAREPATAVTDKGMLLNGITEVSVIDLARGTVYSVPYPVDTDRYRLLERSGAGM